MRNIFAVSRNDSDGSRISSSTILCEDSFPLLLYLLDLLSGWTSQLKDILLRMTFGFLTLRASLLLSLSPSRRVIEIDGEHMISQNHV